MTDGLDGLDNGMDRDIKNVGDGRLNQKFFQDGGVYNTTTQDFGTVNYSLPGNHNGSLYANNTYQKYGNVNTLDTWRSNKNYLDRVRKTIMFRRKPFIPLLSSVYGVNRFGLF